MILLNKKALLEAALFVTDKPLSLEKLSKIVGEPIDKIKTFLKEIEEELLKEEHGIHLASTPEGYELRIKPEYRDSVVELAPFSDLSDGMMRTLALVSLKQPIKQSVIVMYQGNKAYGYIKALEKKGLVKTEKFGRTKLVRTTPDFEKYFGKSKEEVQKALEKALEKNK